MTSSSRLPSRASSDPCKSTRLILGPSPPIWRSRTSVSHSRTFTRRTRMTRLAWNRQTPQRVWFTRLQGINSPSLGRDLPIIIIITISSSSSSSMLFTPTSTVLQSSTVIYTCEKITVIFSLPLPRACGHQWTISIPTSCPGQARLESWAERRTLATTSCLWEDYQGRKRL